MSAPAPRIQHGVALPAVPRRPAQEVLELEPSACLPRGYALAERESGLHLVRESDGAGMGVMASVDFALRHAATLARMDAQRQAREEAA